MSRPYGARRRPGIGGGPVGVGHGPGAFDPPPRRGGAARVGQNGDRSLRWTHRSDQAIESGRHHGVGGVGGVVEDVHRVDGPARPGPLGLAGEVPSGLGRSPIEKPHSHLRSWSTSARLDRQCGDRQRWDGQQ